MAFILRISIFQRATCATSGQQLARTYELEAHDSHERQSTHLRVLLLVQFAFALGLRYAVLFVGLFGGVTDDLNSLRVFQTRN